ncbi:CHAT domain-containing protein [Spirulina sp. CS-785/01]|uniref:CHAT domain-containing protein n=1 Tax=Spirulina sp. CS-785/01 TaxID=3021716 RepID=UPI00232DC57E|nr:CHAT domain-containing protein [Spirulina sp. CS-785/01]MDB9313885.1 CHAT domain-containing protein [Spirulina sp. CS-785/01]
MFQEFQLSVTPLGDDRYLIRTEKVAPGVPLAEEQVQWNTEKWRDRATQLMADPLFHVLQGGDSLEADFRFITGELNQGTTEAATFNLIEFGQQLYESLFQGTLRDSWIAAQSIAHNQRSILRLRLGMRGRELLRLPWEVLHSQESNFIFRPLATGTDVAFSRYLLGSPLGSPTLTTHRSPQQPLRILMAIAQPDDQDSLALQQEAYQLQAELQRNATDSPHLELMILEQPGREELTQALEQGNYQVFHYAGHSDLGEAGGGIYLVNRTTGLTEQLYGEDLAGLLVNNGIQFAVFNSCRSGYVAAENDLSPTANPEQRSLAQSLVQRGIPAVLAMSERIPDEVALTLTRLLYRNLDLGYPIDLSLSRARQGLISAYGSKQLYWALPVLYLHPNFNGLLLDSEEKNLDPLDVYDTEEMPAELLGEEQEVQEDWLADEDLEEEDFLTPEEQNGKQSSMGETTEEGEDSEEADFIKSVLSDFSHPQEPPNTEGETSTSPQPTPPPSESISPQPPLPQKPPSRKQHPALLPGIVGGVVAVLVAVGGVWYWQSQPFNPANLDVEGEVESVDPTNLDFQVVSTDQLTSLAIAQFTEGNLETGVNAVTELLNRNALNYAESALAAVPNQSLDTPSVSFLRGRLAWQSVMVGESNYSVDDARRYWELAVKGDPQSLQYHNALGFAYYAEGKINRANQAWYDALELTDQQVEQENSELTPALLDTYAGLALGLSKLAQDSDGEQQRVLQDKANKLKQKVLNEDPLAYQAQGLSQNWLWTEEAIKDWQEL